MNKLYKIPVLLICTLLFIINHEGCAPKDEGPKCGSETNANWDNIIPTFDGITFGNANFSYRCTISNICIDEDAIISVSVIEKYTTQILNVSAWNLIGLSLTPDFKITHNVGTWDGLTNLNLKQGFSSSPGTFDVKVIITIPANTEAEALSRYNLSVESFFIHVKYSWPKI